ncbi:hypothetical protein M8J77_020650 [Diaphorina citri]|nr:hypothetical protein M8J77_020650 [Diaphorina citri]
MQINEIVFGVLPESYAPNSPSLGSPNRFQPPPPPGTEGRNNGQEMQSVATQTRSPYKNKENWRKRKTEVKVNPVDH